MAVTTDNRKSSTSLHTSVCIMVLPHCQNHIVAHTQKECIATAGLRIWCPPVNGLFLWVSLPQPPLDLWTGKRGKKRHLAPSTRRFIAHFLDTSKRLILGHWNSSMYTLYTLPYHYTGSMYTLYTLPYTIPAQCILCIHTSVHYTSSVYYTSYMYTKYILPYTYISSTKPIDWVLCLSLVSSHLQGLSKWTCPLQYGCKQKK